MTLNELIAQLNTLAEQGHGERNIVIYDEDEGINKSITEISVWETSKETTIDIDVSR